MSKDVDLINVSLKNAYRVRTFTEFLKAVQAGSKRAIREARNVTVDFNKKGVNSQQLGAFLLFANPAIQGTKEPSKRLWVETTHSLPLPNPFQSLVLP